ncbi:27219_t:CDS:10, partial [Gigaspora margarita]
MTHQPINFRGDFSNPELLTEFSCCECNQPINAVDISEKNYSLYVSSQDNQITKDEYDQQTFYSLKFWLQAVKHKRCSLRKAKPNFAFREPLIQINSGMGLNRAEFAAYLRNNLLLKDKLERQEKQNQELKNEIVIEREEMEKFRQKSEDEVIKVRKPKPSHIDPAIEEIALSLENCGMAKTFLQMFAFKGLYEKQQKILDELSLTEEKNEALEEKVNSLEQEIEKKNNEISTLKAKQTNSEEKLEKLEEKTEKDFTRLAIEGAKGLDKSDYTKEEGELTTNLAQITKSKTPSFSIYDLKNPGTLGGVSGYIYFKPEKEEGKKLSPLEDIEKKFRVITSSLKTPLSRLSVKVESVKIDEKIKKKILGKTQEANETFKETLKKFENLAEQYEEYVRDNKLSQEVIEQIKNFNYQRLTSEQKLLLDRLISNKELRKKYYEYGLCEECHQPNTGKGGGWFSGNTWCRICNARLRDHDLVVLKDLHHSQNITVDFLQEIICHNLFDYGNIVKCYGISQDPKTGNYLMIMQNMNGGNLREFLDKYHDAATFEVRFYQLHAIAKICQGLRPDLTNLRIPQLLKDLIARWGESEFARQLQEIEVEYNKTFLNTFYKPHSTAGMTSKRINTKEITRVLLQQQKTEECHIGDTEELTLDKFKKITIQDNQEQEEFHNPSELELEYEEREDNLTEFEKYLQEIEDPKNNREINYGLPKNPDSLQITKYKL